MPSSTFAVTQRHTHPVLLGSLALIGALTLTGCGGGADANPAIELQSSATAVANPTTAPQTSTAAATPASTAPSAAPVAAVALLEGLPVKGRAPKTGYDRDLFGQAWSDDVTVAGGHNGCDTRNDILRRDLTETTFKPGTRDCVVTTGVLDDTYTAKRINFVRGEGTSTAVQIDHVVALSNAWQTGAQQLDEQTRRNFANDPRNLQAVDGPTNSQKSDGDAATWLPPNKAYRCTYVSRQVEVKAAYGLWVTQAENDAIARVLADCSTAPGPAPAPAAAGVAPAPTSAPAPVPFVAPAQAPEPDSAAAPKLAPRPSPAAVPQTSTTYANCAAVRAAGAAPLHAGQPGYSSKLDRDGDGIACE